MPTVIYGYLIVAVIILLVFFRLRAGWKKFSNGEGGLMSKTFYRMKQLFGALI